MNNTSPIPAVDDIFVTDNVSYVTITNLPSETEALTNLFGAIATASISLDLITQIAAYTNKMGVSFSLDDSDFSKLSPLLKNLRTTYPGIEVSASTSNTKISLFGKHMNEYVGVAEAVLTVMRDCGVTPKVISSSETDISLLIDEMTDDELVAKLKATFAL